MQKIKTCGKLYHNVYKVAGLCTQLYEGGVLLSDRRAWISESKGLRFFSRLAGSG